MVCYARPASWLVAIVAVAWLVFSEPVSHFFGTAAVVAAVLAATAGATVAAALVFAAFMSTRRRRAAAGGCVNCRFRCQHAMTGQTRRFRLVTTADRRPRAPAPGHPGPSGWPGGAPGRSVPVLLPVPAVRSAAPGPAGEPAAQPRRDGRTGPSTGRHCTGRARRRVRPSIVPRRERAGSPALAAVTRWAGDAAAPRNMADRGAAHPRRVSGTATSRAGRLPTALPPPAIPAAAGGCGPPPSTGTIKPQAHGHSSSVLALAPRLRQVAGPSPGQVPSHR